MSVARQPLRAATLASGGSPRAVRLELPAGRSCRAVGRLVAGGLASRLDFHVDQIEDLQLAVEAVLSRRPARSTVTLELREADPGLHARIGPLAPAPAERERVRAMLRTLLGDGDVQDSRDGEWIVLSAAKSRPPMRSSPQGG